MKTTLKSYLGLIIVLLFTISCDSDGVAMKLADLSDGSYPTESDKWIIEDSTANIEDFEGLQWALYDVIDQNRKIELVFPNLIEFPEKALYWPGYNSSLTSIVSISARKAKIIGEQAFSGCKNLKSISIRKATSIGNKAFRYCSSLIAIEVNSKYFIFEEPFLFSSDKSEILWASPSISGNHVTPTSVSTIRESAFSGCRSLENISLPGVKFVEQFAFSDCAKLEHIDLPEAIEIGTHSFSSCRGLKSIELPQATYIGNGAFSYCSSLKTISMPNATNISDDAFKYCRSLESLEIATSNNVKLESFSGSLTLFSGVNLRKVTLTLGNANSYMINKLYFNAPSKRGVYRHGPFKKIEIK